MRAECRAASRSFSEASRSLFKAAAFAVAAAVSAFSQSSNVKASFSSARSFKLEASNLSRLAAFTACSSTSFLARSPSRSEYRPLLEAFAKAPLNCFFSKARLAKTRSLIKASSRLASLFFESALIAFARSAQAPSNWSSLDRHKPRRYKALTLSGCNASAVEAWPEAASHLEALQRAMAEFKWRETVKSSTSTHLAGFASSSSESESLALTFFATAAFQSSTMARPSA
mmetsp:Transcript_27728/g.93163  ORF Transcript_27728/g.93163 Transcript_27728/m.93163 type:complete len:229 (+) Transcript_27728:792-1478(+)